MNAKLYTYEKKNLKERFLDKKKFFMIFLFYKKFKKLVSYINAYI